jgi:hypothetical protein
MLATAMPSAARDQLPRRNDNNVRREDGWPVAPAATGLEPPPSTIVTRGNSCYGFAGYARRCTGRADKPISHLRVAQGNSRRGPLSILR